MFKKANLKKLILAMDVIGFIIIFIGAGLIRYSKDEIISILGGFVLAGGVAILGLTRLAKI
jgi:hypothetical protein